MSLENLVKIKQLQHHTATAQEVARLLAAAQASLADAGNTSISDASRFDLRLSRRVDRAGCGAILSATRASAAGADAHLARRQPARPGTGMTTP